jgi:cathepsin C
MEARIRKLYPDLLKKYFGDPKKFSISLKHVLDCSFYNQGCDGGYSLLVSKFFKEFDMIPTECYKTVYPKQCYQKCTDQKARLKLSVSDYYYTGGAYGESNESNIMKEVYENGPISVSLEPHYSFMMYKSGIYDFNAATWFKSNLTKPEWQKVDHSVVLIGWGVEKKNGQDIKYWILQNSWGPGWGENGYMRFRRGVDLLGIESIAEVGIPVVTES